MSGLELSKEAYWMIFLKEILAGDHVIPGPGFYFNTIANRTQAVETDVQCLGEDCIEVYALPVRGNEVEPVYKLKIILSVILKAVVVIRDKVCTVKGHQVDILFVDEQ